MKKTLFTALLLILATALQAAAYRHEFKTVDGDPLNTLQYTLPNGLKVFMTVNRDQPRIQTYVAVRVGGKNDPAETTGLAHYFEHLMFKGTQKFGTQDYEAEKPMLDQIEQLFEKYRVTTDSATRAQIYHQIDSVSYRASLIAIPNEYDKLMSTIGANGTNAYTSQDVTCYIEDIPSNQIENWAAIQADRFANPVLRGFHTELETIYEEKNMDLTRDGRKAINAILSSLFPEHPYGTQTVLGTQEHLKNPSITNVKNYHSQWYVPNNMAICLSGDFDPDQMADTIEKHFGSLKPNPSLPALSFGRQTPITQPVIRDVKGIDAEEVYLAWRLPKAADPDMVAMQILAEVLQNGKCGLIDTNITLPQKTLSAGAFVYDMADGGALIMYGNPKTGQTLDQVRELLLEQIQALRDGKFDQDLVDAIINNYKLSLQKSLENNSDRASLYVDAFVNGQDWADAVAQLKRIDTITKDDITAIANKYLGQNNYVAVNKLQAKDENELKIAKPQLTPIATNRDKASEFLRAVQADVPAPIEPRFLDFDKDLTFAKTAKSDLQVIYTQNKTNDLFQLTFVYEYGNACDRDLAYASSYLSLLGTPDMSAEQVKQAFYKLACTYFVSVAPERTYVVLRGLSENMDKALDLYETLVADVQPDQTVWDALADRLAKAANDAKANQQQNFARLSEYARYGSAENTPSLQLNYTPDQLRGLDHAKLMQSLRNLNNHKHRIIYYGPQPLDSVLASLDNLHRTAKDLADAPKGRKFEYARPDQTVIYIAPYDAKQLYMSLFANRGKMYDPATDPARQMYNEYFGGGMNSIVFQEMRESRSLAYSAWASMRRPSKNDIPYTFTAQIATQNDKMGDAIDAFDQIIEQMPQSQGAFDLAKQSIDSRLRTQRIIKDNMAWQWLTAQDLGTDTDPSKTMFETLPGMTLEDVIAYQQLNVKDNTYHYAILGNIEDLDLEKLGRLGKVVVLTTEDIFGY